MIDRPKSGEPIRASWASNVTDALNGFVPFSSAGMLLSESSGGFSFRKLPENKRVRAADASDIDLFRVRYVENNLWDDGDIPYTGWEIYMPEGSVSVGATCSALNPSAYRRNEDGEDETLDGWYRLPAPSNPVSEQSWKIKIHAKCCSAHYGHDYFAEWPKRYVWAEISKVTADDDDSSSDSDDEYDNVNTVGDTFEATVGAIFWTIPEGESAPVKSVSHYVKTAFNVLDVKANSGNQLLFAFAVNIKNTGTIELELKYIYLRNPTVEAAGLSFFTTSMIEITKTHQLIYLMVSTKTNPYTGKIVTFSGSDTVNDTETLKAQEEVLSKQNTGEAYYLIYQLKNGHVVSDLRNMLYPALYA